jgi:Protein of unknown function (DUF4232)
MLPRFRLPFAVILIVLTATFTATPAVAQTPACSFVLGFAALDSLIPDVVGTCIDNESFNPENGDSLQPTTNGLMVWRKSDNFTAFTDGFLSWVNGPLGLQEREDQQRFWWEGNPDNLAIIPTPVDGDRCHTSGLELGVGSVDAGAGNVFATFNFTNQLGVSCTFFGFPGAGLRDAADNPLPTNVVWDGGPLADSPEPTTVLVPPFGTAQFLAHWGQVPVGDETTCPQAAGLAVIPPDEFVPVIVPIAIRACDGGRLDISSVQPATTASQ